MTKIGNYTYSFLNLNRSPSQTMNNEFENLDFGLNLEHINKVRF